MTPIDYYRLVREFALAHAPARPNILPEGSPCAWNPALRFGWSERGWGINVRLDFDLRSGTAEINSSTTTRGVRDALAFATLYRQVTEFAAVLEAFSGDRGEVDWEGECHA